MNLPFTLNSLTENPGGSSSLLMYFSAHLCGWTLLPMDYKYTCTCQPKTFVSHTESEIRVIKKL